MGRPTIDHVDMPWIGTVEPSICADGNEGVSLAAAPAINAHCLMRETASGLPRPMTTAASSGSRHS